MSNLRITANRMFALEGLRSCLEDTSLPHGELLGNTWLTVDTLEESKEDNDRHMRIKFKVRIMGVSSAVVATCYIENTENSGLGWDRGSCDIEFPDGWGGLIWNFSFKLRDGKLTAVGLFSESALGS